MARLFLGDEGTSRVFASAVKAPIDLKDETLSVPAANLRGVPITLPYSGTVTLEVDVVKGKHVTVNMVDATDWNEIANAKSKLFGGKFHHYPAFEGTESASLRRKGHLAEGSYYVVLENPTLGILVPSSFDVRVKARLEP
ncbi:MAG: hypothetical protein IT375_14740 [Polyangiaceae bacterium]|nr:hypothetical protein [Polyangiaceae bacterium]